MRLDKYLKVSRLIKRRTVANEVADAGRILINGKVAKASQAVNAGDIIEVTFGNRPIKVRVLSDVEPPHERRCPRDVRGDRGITALPARIQCWQRGTAYGKSVPQSRRCPMT